MSHPLPDKRPVVHVDAGREWRGGQAQVLTLMHGLHNAGITQMLVAPEDSPLLQRAREAGLMVHALPLRGDLDLPSAWRLHRLCLHTAPAIVHCHDAHAHAIGWFGTKALPETRLVVSRRVDFPVGGNALSRRKYTDARVRFLAISQGVRDVLVRDGVAPDNIQIVPSGVDPNRLEMDASGRKVRDELGIPARSPVIGTIGSLVDHKDHRNFVAAAALVQKRSRHARFIIVGDGPERGNLERQIDQLGLRGSCHPVGYREDIGSCLSAFDVFVVASHLEGLNTSMIDAMLAGLPCVGTDTGGIPDLIVDEKTGLLVPPRNAAALATAIQRLIDDPSLAERVAEGGRAHARAGFTSEALIEKTLEAYTKIWPSPGT